MILVIDDMKTFPFPDDAIVIYARSLDDGKKYLLEFDRVYRQVSGYDMPDKMVELWLDHDLGINPVTGEEEDIRSLCLYLAERAFNGNPYPVGKIVICSLNPVGVEWIQSTLEPYYTVKRWYFDGRDANFKTINDKEK